MVHFAHKNLCGLVILLGAALLTGCGGPKEDTSDSTKMSSGGGGAKSGPATTATLSGNFTLDGSSTVMPISQAMVEEFGKTNAGLKMQVNESGTGGGFKKFLNKEIEICDASRPITKEEQEIATKNGVEYIELPIAYDGLSVVVNKDTAFVDCLKVEELKKIWEPTSKIASWKDVRAGFPNLTIKLYGPGTDSGTFEYFTEAIVGKKKSSRADYTASEDDNTLVQGVAGDKGGLGYFGLAYYEQNKDKLKVLGVDNGKGCVAPSAETVNNGTYQPLSRPLFIYIRKDMAEKPEIQAFVKYYLSAAARQNITKAGYVLLPDSVYTAALERFEKRTTGSVFSGSDIGTKIEDLMKKEAGTK